MRHLLFYQRGGSVVFLVQLVKQEISISGYPNLKPDVCVMTHQVSRRHAKLTRSSQGYTLEDLGSYYGTFVNGTRLFGDRLLRDGDAIRFHTYEASYHIVLPETQHDLLVDDVFQTGDHESQAVYSDWLEEQGYTFAARGLRGDTYFQII